MQTHRIETPRTARFHTRLPTDRPSREWSSPLGHTATVMT